MNGEENYINGNILDLLRNMDLEGDNLSCFYLLIIVIFIIDQAIKGLAANK